MAPRAARYDLAVQRGSYGALGAFTFALTGEDDAPTDLTSATVTLIVFINGAAVLTKSTADSTLSKDLENSSVTWTPLEAEKRLIPRSRLAEYTLDIAYPSDHTGFVFMYGVLQGIGP